jgi:hypothetical protein
LPASMRALSLFAMETRPRLSEEGRTLGAGPDQVNDGAPTTEPAGDPSVDGRRLTESLASERGNDHI